MKEMSENTKRELRANLKRMGKQFNEFFIDYGKAIVQVKRHRLWEEWGFDSLEDYLNREVGMGIAYANACALITTSARELKITRKELAELGYSRMVEIIRVMTPETKDAWMSKARTLRYGDMVVAVRSANHRRMNSGRLATRMHSVHQRTVKRSVEQAGNLLEQYCGPTDDERDRGDVPNRAEWTKNLLDVLRLRPYETRVDFTASPEGHTFNFFIPNEMYAEVKEAVDGLTSKSPLAAG